MAANRVGKTQCGAYETVCHATGVYPDWWEGKRFTHPVLIWTGSKTSATSRDIIHMFCLASSIRPGQGSYHVSFSINASQREAYRKEDPGQRERRHQPAAGHRVDLEITDKPPHDRRDLGLVQGGGETRDIDGDQDRPCPPRHAVPHGIRLGQRFGAPGFGGHRATRPSSVPPRLTLPFGGPPAPSADRIVGIGPADARHQRPLPSREPIGHITEADGDSAPSRGIVERCRAVHPRGAVRAAVTNTRPTRDRATRRTRCIPSSTSSYAARCAAIDDGYAVDVCASNDDPLPLSRFETVRDRHRRHLGRARPDDRCHRPCHRGPGRRPSGSRRDRLGAAPLGHPRRSRGRASGSRDEPSRRRRAHLPNSRRRHHRRPLGDRRNGCLISPPEPTPASTYARQHPTDRRT